MPSIHTIGQRLAIALLYICLIIRSPDFFAFDIDALHARTSRSLPITMLFCSIPFFVMFSTFVFKRTRTIFFLCFIFALFKGYDEYRPIPALSCSTSSWSESTGTVRLPRPCKVLVTGANSGIGFAVTTELAKQGHHVSLACRSIQKCQNAIIQILNTHLDPDVGLPSTSTDTLSCDPGPIDLSSLLSVQAYVEKNTVTYDYIFNNAGFTPSTNSTAIETGIELGLSTMHVGHIALLHLLRQKKQLAKDVTIVHVSSDAMRLGAFHNSILDNDLGNGDLSGEITIGCTPVGGAVTPFCLPPTVLRDTTGDTAGKTAGKMITASYLSWLNFGSYPRAKLANVYAAREIPKRWPKIKRSVSVMPGMVHTPMATRSAPGTKESFFNPLQESVMWILLRSAKAASGIVLTAAKNAKRNEGCYFNGQGQCIPDRQMPVQARDEQLQKKLWDVTMRVIRKGVVKN